MAVVRKVSSLRAGQYQRIQRHPPCIQQVVSRCVQVLGSGGRRYSSHAVRLAGQRQIFRGEN